MIVGFVSQSSSVIACSNERFVTGEGGGGEVQLAPGALDAINKVLTALLAASSQQSASEPSTSAPTTTTTETTSSETAQRGAPAQQLNTEPDRDQPPPAKKSFLKVIDHQNQPASRSSGMADSADVGDWRSRAGGSPDYRSLSSSSYQDPPYHRRIFPIGDDDRYADMRREYQQYQSPRFPSYYDSTRRAGSGSEFWNEMSNYCAEYEARLGRREDFGDASSRFPRRPPAHYPDELDRRRFAAESSMSAPRGNPDPTTAARQYSSEELSRYYRDLREADLRRAAADSRQADYWSGPREAAYSTAVGTRDRSADYDKGT